MARLSELIVKITSDTAQFSRGVREVSVEMQRLSSVSENAVRGIRTAFERIGAVGTRLTVGVSAPLAALGVAAVKADADLEALRMGLISVSGSAAAADKQLARLAEVAKLPGLGFREAIQGSVNLQAAGFSAQLAERSLKAFGNALATVGKGKADLDGVILALTQIQSKGKISAQEINQLGERLPQIRAAMKAAFGTADTEALQKMGISTQEFIERIVAEFEKLPPVTGGVKNAFENIRDAAERAMAEFGAALRPGTELVTKFAEAAVSKLADMAKGFRELPPAIQATAVALGGLAVAAGPALAAIGQIGLGITGIATAIPVIKAMSAAVGAGTVALGSFVSAIIGQLIPAVAGANAYFYALRGSMLAVSIALVGMEVARLVAAFQQFRSEQNRAREATEQQNRSIEILRIKLHQAGISTAELDQAYRRAEISIAQYARGLMQLATAHKATHQAADEAKRQTMDLAEAFRVLGVDSTETLTKRYQQARDALAAVEQAYREGKASAMDLARAQEAVRQAFEAVHKPIKAVREELGKIQGPDNVGTVLRDMVSEIAGGAQAKEAEQRLRSIAEILSLRGFEPDRFPWAVANTYTAVERLGLAAQVVQRHVRSMWEAIASEDLARQAEQGIRRTAEMLGINIDQLRRLDEAKKRLGIEKERDIGQMQSDVDTVWRSDLPLRQKQRAEYELLLEKRKQGIELSKFEEERLRSLDRIFRSSAKSMESFGDAVARQVSTVLTDTGRRLSDLVFQGGKLKDVLVGSFEAFGKALLRLAIERQLANIAGAIGSIVAKLPGLSKIASVFGGGAAAAAGGGAAAATASSTAAAAGQIASQTAGTVGKVIGTSFTALAGVVTGAISAVTGIIGVFQAARQESSLNAIEWNTRKSSLHLEHIIHRINAGLPGFGDVQARIVEVRDVLIGWDQYITGGLKLAGGGGSITINMDGANFIGFRDLDAFLDELVRRLKQRGL
jgi:tape measure domain-containing protein